MIIGIDARFALEKRRGIGNYTLNLIKHLTQLNSQNQYILYTNKLDAENVLPKSENLTIKIITPSNYLFWEQIALPKQAAKDKVDILHCTANTAPLFLTKNIKLIITVHDIMYLKKDDLLPKSDVLYQRLGRIYRSTIVPQTIQKAKKIITVSNFSKQDILLQFPSISPNSIQAIYEAADSVFSLMEKNYALKIIKSKFNINGNYLLTLGGTDPRKNTKLVIKAFFNLKQQNKINEKLVIVGIPNWKQTEFYDIVDSLNCENDVIFTDFVTQKELVCLYNCASIFLYPSLYEGFGIPPLEAMACGTPIITSNVTSIPEIVGDAAIQINPYVQAELEAAIDKLLTNSFLKNELIQRGISRAKKFSWHHMAEETLNIYQNIFS